MLLVFDFFCCFQRQVPANCIVSVVRSPFYDNDFMGSVLCELISNFGT